jgi:hypothetical protein
MAEHQKQPKVFISYSHTSLAHKEFVRHTATNLTSRGIEVTLDQWDARIGHDLNAFMEQISVDDLTHVLIFSDRTYTEKANSRSGGVGREAIIITQEIYESVRQEKFVPIVCERDGEGFPYLPVFLKGRKYVDLSSERNFEEEFRELVLHIYGQSEHEKPALGEIPDFVKRESSHSENPKHIYQNNRKVGVVEGGLREEQDFVVFPEISETESLDHREPFQYMGREYRIYSIEGMIGQMNKMVVSNSGMKSVAKHNVLQKVKCIPLEAYIDFQSSLKNVQKGV